MLVNDRMVVLRLRKCATAQVVVTVRAVVGGEFRKTSELGRTDLTSHGRIDFPLEGRRVLGTIRNPWSWYVSLWAYGCSGRGGLHARVTMARSRRSTLGAMVREAKATHGLPREAVARHRSQPPRAAGWTALYADPDDPAAFRSWLTRILDPRYAHLVEPWYGATALPPSVGLLTWRYLALFARDPAPLLDPRGFATHERLRSFDETGNVCNDIIRTDRIAAELPDVLTRAGYELDAAQQATLAEHLHDDSRRNASKHRPWSDYYDTESIALVAARDRLIVERHGFEVPAAP